MGLTKAKSYPALHALMIAAIIACGAPGAATAQSFQTGGSNPIQVDAKEIEWRRDERQYVANGDAVATQGNNRVLADKLIAFYRESGDGASALGGDIYRLEAVGNVRIVSPNQTITGVRAVREIDRGLVWIVGNPPTLKTPTQIVTAKERLEYWDKTEKAVAKGDAEARDLETGRIIRADELEADLSKDPNAPTAAPRGGIREIIARNNVRIITENEVITGDNGTYNPISGVAVLTGDVRLVGADGRQLSGGRAEVNMKTGISRLFGDPVDGERPALLLNMGTPGRSESNNGSTE